MVVSSTLTGRIVSDAETELERGLQADGLPPRRGGTATLPPPLLTTEKEERGGPAMHFIYCRAAGARTVLSGHA